MKIKALLLALALILTLSANVIATSATEESSSDAEAADVLYGDTNGDGAVNSLDAAAVLKSDVGMISLTEAQSTAADVNLDTKVDSLDAAQILKYDAGILKYLVDAEEYLIGYLVGEWLTSGISNSLVLRYEFVRYNEDGTVEKGYKEYVRDPIFEDSSIDEASVETGPSYQVTKRGTYTVSGNAVLHSYEDGTEETAQFKNDTLVFTSVINSEYLGEIVLEHIYEKDE
ncbi:MAG: dockerin type I repeat-containing protein [Clostridia bacterium]|nr:dockerin type I repeat-containing protein [Clostridia bacterium]